MLCFLKIDPVGSIYNENKIGPKMDPWGIPHVRGAVDDVNSPKATEKLL